MIARRHHFLPQCYLRGFSQPRKRGKIHNVVVFDRNGKKFTANVLNIAVKHDFNRVDIQDHPPDIVERDLARFEDDLAPALRRISQAGNIGEQKDREILFNFIAHIAVRNPRHREKFRKFNEEIARAIMEISTATEERWQSQVRQLREAGYAGNDSSISYESMREFVRKRQYRIDVSNEFHIATEIGGVDAVLPTLFDRKWISLRPPSGSKGFITSDHPVCLMFSDPKLRGGLYGPGHGMPGTQVIFPVSKSLAVVGAFELSEAERVVDERWIAQINGALIAYAERQIYSHDADFTYLRGNSESLLRGGELVNDIAFRRK